MEPGEALSAASQIAVALAVWKNPAQAAPNVWGNSLPIPNLSSTVQICTVVLTCSKVEFDLEKWVQKH
jgi:hypothetical protein